MDGLNRTLVARLDAGEQFKHLGVTVEMIPDERVRLTFTAPIEARHREGLGVSEAEVLALSEAFGLDPGLALSCECDPERTSDAIVSILAAADMVMAPGRPTKTAATKGRAAVRKALGLELRKKDKAVKADA